MATQQKPNRKLTDKGFTAYMNMGFTMLVTILVCVLAGIYTDKFIGWKFPLFTVVGSLIGVFGAIYTIIRKL